MNAHTGTWAHTRLCLSTHRHTCAHSGTPAIPCVGAAVPRDREAPTRSQLPGAPSAEAAGTSVDRLALAPGQAGSVAGGIPRAQRPEAGGSSPHPHQHPGHGRTPGPRSKRPGSSCSPRTGPRPPSAPGRPSPRVASRPVSWDPLPDVHGAAGVCGASERLQAGCVPRRSPFARSGGVRGPVHSSHVCDRRRGARGRFGQGGTAGAGRQAGDPTAQCGASVGSREERGAASTHPNLALGAGPTRTGGPSANALEGVHR